MVKNKILIELSVEKAKEALISAKLNIENGMLTTAENRIYYSIFYCVSALGYMNDYVTSKHGQLIGWFNRKFISEEKVFDIWFGKTYKKAFEHRMRGDYNFQYKPTKEAVERSLEDAVTFVEKVTSFINSTFDKK